jgi:hypothetical protein
VTSLCGDPVISSRTAIPRLDSAVGEFGPLGRTYAVGSSRTPARRGHIPSRLWVAVRVLCSGTQSATRTPNWKTRAAVRRDRQDRVPG